MTDGTLPQAGAGSSRGFAAATKTGHPARAAAKRRGIQKTLHNGSLWRKFTGDRLCGEGSADRRPPRLKR
jgi:hypothetical protein